MSKIIEELNENKYVIRAVNIVVATVLLATYIVVKVLYPLVVLDLGSDLVKILIAFLILANCLTIIFVLVLEGSKYN